MTEVELLPFGGVAKTDEWGTVPAQEELLVAMAGPAYNGIMIVFGAVCYVSGWWSPEWAHFFVTANLWLGGFNLLPIYPLDGGRILEALLSYQLTYRSCMMYSLVISSILSVGMLGASVWPLLYGQPLALNVAIIALFLLISNILMWRQKNYQHMRFLLKRQIDDRLSRKPVKPILVTPQEPILSVMKKWKKEVYHVIVVRDDKGSVIRVLPEESLLNHFFHGTSPLSKLCELLD